MIKNFLFVGVMTCAFQCYGMEEEKAEISNRSLNNSPANSIANSILKNISQSPDSSSYSPRTYMQKRAILDKVKTILEKIENAIIDKYRSLPVYIDVYFNRVIDLSDSDLLKISKFKTDKDIFVFLDAGFDDWIENKKTLFDYPHLF